MSEQLQGQLDQLNKTVNDINDFTNDLAGDLDFIVKENERLIGQLEAGDANVTENLRAINGALTDRAATLKALASRVDQPVPPPPAVPIETITNPVPPQPEPGGTPPQP